MNIITELIPLQLFAIHNLVVTPVTLSWYQIESISTKVKKPNKFKIIANGFAGKKCTANDQL